jgi:hypothetical protein
MLLEVGILALANLVEATFERTSRLVDGWRPNP